MIVTWFTPPRRSLEWFGQMDGTLALIERGGMSAIASVIGPPGAGASVGPGFKLVGSEIRYDITSLTRG